MMKLLFATAVVAMASASVSALDPDIKIEKTVHVGHWNKCSTGEDLEHGFSQTPVTYCYKVTNTGQTDLGTVRLTDSTLGLNNRVVSHRLGLKQSVFFGVQSKIYRTTKSSAAVSATPVNSSGRSIGSSDVKDYDAAEVILLEKQQWTCDAVGTTSFITKNPTSRPTRNPTSRPTRNPTSRPTRNPTSRPTRNPVPRPTRNPTSRPTKAPVARSSNIVNENFSDKSYGQFKFLAGIFYHTQSKYNKYAQDISKWSSNSIGVRVGGVDRDDVRSGMSGGFYRDFKLAKQGKIVVTVRYKFYSSSGIDKDRDGLAMVQIDHTPKVLKKLYGRDKKQTYGYVTEVATFDGINSGNRRFYIGVYMNKKYYTDETYSMNIGSLKLDYVPYN